MSAALTEGLDPYLNRAYWADLMVGDTTPPDADHATMPEIPFKLERFGKRVLTDFILKSHERGAFPLEEFGAGSTLDPNSFAVGSVFTLQGEDLAIRPRVNAGDRTAFRANAPHIISSTLKQRIYDDPLHVIRRPIHSGPLVPTDEAFLAKRLDSYDERVYRAHPGAVYDEFQYHNLRMLSEDFAAMAETEWNVRAHYHSSRDFLVVVRPEEEDSKRFVKYVSLAGLAHITKHKRAVRGLFSFPVREPVIELGETNTSVDDEGAWRGAPIVTLSRDNAATLYTNGLPERKKSRSLSRAFGLRTATSGL